MHDGLRRMVQEQEDVYYYITVMNENYVHPELPAGAEAGILKGMYRFKQGGAGQTRVQLLGSGAILNEVIAAANLLKRIGTSRPTSGAAQASRCWRARATMSRAGTCCIRPKSRALLTSRSA